ncbi:hypothetical protein NL676_003334 [Syzygium grande]|nr:hypothetical protein NL676_003334 [Syzygium grande]
MTISATPSIRDGSLIMRGQVVLTGVPGNITVKPLGFSSAFIGATSETPRSRHVFTVGVLEGCRFLSLFRAKIWWMMPRVGDSADKIPPETQMLLVEAGEKSALENGVNCDTNSDLLDGAFRASLLGNSANELQFCVESGDTNVQTTHSLEAVFINSAHNPFELLKESIKILEEQKGTFSGIENKKHLLVHADLYLWHALAGYWGGVLPSSEKLKKYNPKLLYPVQSDGNVSDLIDMAMDCLEKYGVGLIDPRRVHDFYDDLHSYLAKSSADGVKVDVQNTLETSGQGYGGRVALTRQYQEALEQSIARNFKENDIIRCMSHNTESIYSCSVQKRVQLQGVGGFHASRTNISNPTSRLGGFNSLLLGEIVVPDWDMFYSKHNTAGLHAAARAVGGCSVYLSDKPGNYDFNILRKLVLPDGSVLRARCAGRPTRDCLFKDPVMDGESLLKIWNLNKLNGVVGVFNCQGAGAWPLKEGGQEKPITAPIRPPILGHVRPLDVELLEDIAGDNWEGDSAVYAFHTGSLRALSRRETVEVWLRTLSCEICTISPIRVFDRDVHFAPIRLLDMHNSGGAVEELTHRTDPSCEAVDGSELTRAAGHSGARWMQRKRSFTYSVEDKLLTLKLPGECRFWDVEAVF